MTLAPCQTGAGDHDHSDCIADALREADRLCAERGVRLTEIRRRVLELVWRNHAPVGAYELLKELTKERQSAVPPTIYRALEFLVEQGLVHRIESLNAYVGCAHPDEPHCSHFIICRDCGLAAELTGFIIDKAIRASAEDCGFLVEGDTVEVTGLCAQCRSDAGEGRNQ